MKATFSGFFATFALFTAGVFAASSSNFTLQLYSPGTVLSEAKLYIDDENRFLMSNTTDEESITAYITTNGSLHLNSEGVLAGIGKNYLSTKGMSSSYEIAYPWSISGGYLKLYGSHFHAVPSGEDGEYVLGSINAAAGRSTTIVVMIKAVGEDGEVVDDYNPSANNGAASSVAVASTMVTAVDTSQTSASESTSGSSNGVGVMKTGLGLILMMMVL